MLTATASIILEFSLIDTEVRDVIRVFDGPTESSPLLRTLSGSGVLVANVSIRSTGNNLMIRFTSDDAVASQGFMAR